MKQYTLYLDESETANFNKILQKRENTIFVIAGIICKNDYHEQILKPQVNRVKSLIWNRCDNDPLFEDKILHELEMSRALKKQYKQLKYEYNKIFKNKHIYNFTYDILTEIFRNSEITILAVCINEDELSKQFDASKLNDRFQIAMNMIIENYYHFLNSVNGIGHICYESLPENQNERIRKRYMGIKYNGTMFYPAKVINSRIKSLEFKNKTENIVGLQLADFVPNAIGRNVLKKHYTDNKERNVSIEALYSKLYDGEIQKKEKFGLKIIP